MFESFDRYNFREYDQNNSSGEEMAQIALDMNDDFVDLDKNDAKDITYIIESYNIKMDVNSESIRFELDDFCFSILSLVDYCYVLFIYPEYDYYHYIGVIDGIEELTNKLTEKINSYKQDDNETY